ncbi:MAG: hypothetical protein EWV57_17650 [Microcystis aeruginosa Ma_QC_Ch_20071001_S25D]|uniref:Uncharacterized protein n=1 Tax=Microcystis aeruginosa Ma_QC_Ch_20071001_S25D TaxID=2486250 RepID=A0A552FJH3_MICAE|nr:MAG: hypothetical protein EWV57_17650 [Microcystis aeruginosa Ma_QC_Ch_20071001_S25D]
MAIARRFSIRKFAKWLLLSRVCRINLKTLLGKTFRPFGNQQVPGMGVIRGKIQVVKPYTQPPTPTEKLFQQLLSSCHLQCLRWGRQG